MYLDHFALTRLPFALTPDADFFCALDMYNAALNLIKISLHNGEGFIKIIGEVGTGKTFLCRKLLRELDTKKYITAYLPNPNLDHATLYEALLIELGIQFPPVSKQYELLNILNNALLELYRKHKNVVVIIDEAQNLGDEILEAIRLLSNLETESSKLLHIVLFGQPELDKRLNKQNLRQLRQRISFSYYLRSLSLEELETYTTFRLSAAGYRNGQNLFSRTALRLLLKATSGIPRLVNAICHKALLVAYGRSNKTVTAHDVLIAIKDTDSTTILLKKHLISGLMFLGLFAVLSAELYYATKWLLL